MILRTVGVFSTISLYLIACDVCGVVASRFGRNKGYSAIGMYFVGLLLFIVGLVIAMVMPYKPSVASGEVEPDKSQDKVVTIIAAVVGILALVPFVYVMFTPIGQLTTI
jgi:hypothetical protein